MTPEKRKAIILDLESERKKISEEMREIDDKIRSLKFNRNSDNMIDTNKALIILGKKRQLLQDRITEIKKKRVSVTDFDEKKKNDFIHFKWRAFAFAVKCMMDSEQWESLWNKFDEIMSDSNINEAMMDDFSNEHLKRLKNVTHFKTKFI